MTEASFWGNLEYRLCSEFAGLPNGAISIFGVMASFRPTTFWMGPRADHWSCVDLQ